MNSQTKFLGIDIGGAHLKIIGLDKKMNVSIVKYKSCPLWEGLGNLKKEIQLINTISKDKNIKCGITMTGELCDFFKTRIDGAKIIHELCKKIKFEKYFYSTSEGLSKQKTLNFNDIISMNWYAIGDLLKKIVKDTIIIDFGSTTTDFICIKNYKIMNTGRDDFSRINNLELVYSGLTRTPTFGITRSIKIKNHEYRIIPEFFSDSSDVYRILGMITKSLDIDEVADKSKKTARESMARLARSFGFDFKTKNKRLIGKLAQKLSQIQIEEILTNLNYLYNKFQYDKDTPIILAGIGQDVLYNNMKKKYNVSMITQYLPGKNTKLKHVSSYHAPALCIANLLRDSQ
tara:strand:- start:6917 stop:7951 length:1035 start_codon:yes stop_codon:yes gene_type:complete